jgi:pimeloyl-ACP methyl ester carboxylesterase
VNNAHPGHPALHTHRVGSGEPLLLVHGLGSHAMTWSPIPDGLAPQRSVIAVDLLILANTR